MCQLASTKIASLVTFEGLTRSGATFLEESDREGGESDWVASLRLFGKITLITAALADGH